MKKTTISLGAAVLSSAILFLTGCKQGEKSPAGQPAKSPVEKGGIVSAEKNSFNEVTAKLDKGGNFYMYLSTEQWLTGVSDKVGDLREFVLQLPQVPSDDREKVEKVFNVIQDGVKESGIEQVSGVGMSSIAREPGFYYSKFILHHYKEQKAGFLWSLFGQQPHAMNGLDLLPGNTAVAAFSDMDLQILWNVITNSVTRMDVPEVDKALTEFPAIFAKQTGMSFDELLNSLGGEYGLVMTLDSSKQIAIPLGTNGMKIPEPGLMIIAKVKGDGLFNRIEASMKGNQSIIRVDESDLKMRTMPFPLPLPIQLRPTVARSGDYLFVATTDTLIREALAVKKGEKPGWKASDEYKKLSQGLPAQGNSFFFMSPKLGAAFAEVQKQALSAKGDMTESQSELLKKLLGGGESSYSFSVAANTDEGWEVYANGNQSMNRVALVPAAFAGGLLAAIAVPNFVKARETAQKNACINNLRQLDGAKEQWAIEHSKKVGARPSGQDLYGPNGYMKHQPVCPAGGTYTINPIGTNPTCSHAGHVLPK